MDEDTYTFKFEDFKSLKVSPTLSKQKKQVVTS